MWRLEQAGLDQQFFAKREESLLAVQDASEPGVTQASSDNGSDLQILLG
jgi:hypothetical protein